MTGENDLTKHVAKAIIKALRESQLTTWVGNLEPATPEIEELIIDGNIIPLDLAKAAIEVVSEWNNDQSFAEAWQTKGYQYSNSNIEKVRIGWQMAQARIIKLEQATADSALAIARRDQRIAKLEEALRKIDEELWALSGTQPKLEPQAFVDKMKRIEAIISTALSKETP